MLIKKNIYGIINTLFLLVLQNIIYLIIRIIQQLLIIHQNALGVVIRGIMTDDELTVMEIFVRGMR